MAVTILPFVQQIMIRYIMSTYFAFGLIGNIFNCIIFTKQALRQQTPCSIYLLALSIFAFIYLLWSVVPLLYTLDHVDPQVQSLVYCKVRLYGSHVLGQFVRFSVVFACADRFFITRASAHIRAWSSFQTAKKMITVMCIFWLIAGSHLPVFMDIRGGVCWMFDFYKFFYPIYQCILVGVLPPVLMSVFGFLTVSTLRRRRSTNEHIRQKDHDLMRMLIAEILINIVTSIPFSANLLYGTATFYVVGKSGERVEIENFVNFVSQFFIHLLSVAPFYLFLMSSKSFRREFVHIIRGYWHNCIRRRGKVGPAISQITATVQHKEQAHSVV
ncbi:unnamed protein product [Adineta ricciae]|uniref:G-protein coupled receptors family 1 profile domain-containing protein n=1 Tax=Adineta ricciae TaxID=249248 RepID=A0A814GR81_ADIRI|nr:unnamed protein product [Adineta ricciae]